MDNSNKHIHVVSKHIGAVFVFFVLLPYQVVGGYNPDGRYAIDRARDHTVQFKEYFGEEMPPRVLSEKMGQFVHLFTCYGGYRPLGINILFGGWDHRENRYDLYRVTPSGQCFVFFHHPFHIQRHFAESVGKGRQACKAEIEKHNLVDLTVEEALPYVTKMQIPSVAK